MARDYAKRTAKPYEAPEDERRIIADIVAKREAQSGLTKYRQSRYVLNGLFLAGHQWIRYIIRTGRFAGIGSKIRRIRLTVNRLRELATRDVSEMMVASPEFFVAPASNTHYDLMVARTCEGMLETAWREHNLKSKERMWLWRRQPEGVSIIRVEWDPTKGAHIWTGQTHEWVPGVGDLDVTVESAATMLFDPFALHPDEARWCMTVNLRPIEFAYRHYPDKADYVVCQNLTPGEVDFARGDSGNRRDQTFNVHDDQMPRYIEMCYFERPSEDYPRGRVLVLTDNIILNDPGTTLADTYEDCDFPIVFIADQVQPDTIWPLAKIDQARDLQIQLNTTLSQIAERKNLEVVPKLIAPQGLIVNYASLSPAFPGVIETQPWMAGQGTVTPLQLGPPAVQAEAFLQMILNLMDQAYQFPAPTRGLESPNVRSGRLARLLQQAAAVTQTDATEAYTDGMERLAKKILSRYHQHAPEARLARWFDQNGIVYVRQFKAAAMVGGQDIKLLTKPGNILRREQHRAETLELVQFGLFRPEVEEDRKIVMRVLEYESPRELFGNDARDAIRAQWEHNQMANLDETGKPYPIGQTSPWYGITMPVQPYDNHEIHLREHKSFCKNMEFLQYPPQVQQSIVGHMELHAQELLPPEMVAPPPQGRAGGSLPRAKIVPGAEPAAAEARTTTRTSEPLVGSEREAMHINLS